MQTTTGRLEAVVDCAKRETGIDSVEVTIRGEREFTISADGKHEERLTSFVSKIGGKVDGVQYDAEIDFTCVYFSA